VAEQGREGGGRLVLHLALLAAAAALACAGGSGAPQGDDPGAASGARAAAPGEPGQPKTPAPQGPFPTPQELEDLTDAPAPDLSDSRAVDVESWTLEGPFPDRIGELPIRDPGTFEAVLMEASTARAGLLVASESMRCAARELGRFFVSQGGLPGEALQRYVLGRCGATGTGLNVGFFHEATPPDASPERVFEVWGNQVRRMVNEQLGPGPRAAGIWYGRRGVESLVLLVSAPRRGRLVPVSAVPGKDGRLRLSGEALRPVESVNGLVNRGRLGWEECQAVEGVQLPRFELVCATQKSDEVAWISVSAREPGRLLGHSLHRVLARPSGGDARTWRRASYGPPAPVVGPEDFRVRLRDAANGLRAELGMEPLVLEARESVTAGRLAPFYFASGLGMVTPAYADLVALGLMAGWEVKGTIRDANLGAALSLSSHDLDRWLAEALALPGMRSVLFDPEHTQLAVGPVVGADPDAPYLGAILASYALFGEEDPTELRQDFYTVLDRAYDARGLSFPRRERALEVAAQREMTRIQMGAVTPAEALEIVGHEASLRLQAPVGAWLMEGTDLEHMRPPDALFAENTVFIAAAVGHYQPEGWPWGRTLVILLSAPESTLRTARAERDVPAKLH
jgi:hypothetical protein